MCAQMTPRNFSRLIFRPKKKYKYSKRRKKHSVFVDLMYEIEILVKLDMHR